MFYERFIQICERNKEKPTQVLKDIGASSGNLSNWKSGGAVKSDILLQISKHFNVSVDYLLGRTDETNSQSMSNNSISATDIKGDNVQTISGTETISKRDKELLQKINSLSLDDYADIISYINSKIKGTV